jgi:hypothetical protein
MGSLIAQVVEAAGTSETLVDIQLRTRQYIPEDSELHTRRRENLKSHVYTRSLRSAQNELKMGRSNPSVCSPVSPSVFPLECSISGSTGLILTKHSVVRFQIFKAARMKERVFWDIVPYSIEEVDGSFGCIFVATVKM